MSIVALLARGIVSSEAVSDILAAPSEPADVDVLVIGAGPTGLALAGDLKARGVSCRIIDRAPSRSDKSRALAVQPRTLEMLHRFGKAVPLVACGRRGLHVRMMVDGKPAAALDIGDVGMDDTPFPFVLFVSQAETERVLEDRLTELGGAVERPIELVRFASDERGVVATLKRCDGDAHEEQVRARWLVGCDGAHSAVRRGAGLDFAGAAYPQEFVLADVHVDWPDGPPEVDALSEPPLRFFFAKDGILVVFPLKSGASRLIASRAGAVAREGELTLDEMQSIASALVPRPIHLRDPVWLSRFHLHHRGVDRYRRGRVFVAGDAAHIHSPAGGQGMNTGIQDALNLAWKIALVARGEAPERILDTYDEERRPVGQRLLAYTDRLFSFAASPSRFVLGVRNLLAPRLARFVVARKERRARAFRFISQLGIAYRKSSIVGEERAHRLTGGPRPGARAPDGPLRGSRSSPPPAGTDEVTLFDRMRCARFCVVAFGAACVSLESARIGRLADRVEGIAVADDAAVLRERYGADGAAGAWYLIRPDGYVAWRGVHLDAKVLEHALDVATARAGRDA